MKRSFVIVLVISICTAVCVAQKKTSAPPRTNTARSTPPPSRTLTDKGTVDGRTYTNRTLGFTITFPDTWLIPGDDFEAEMRKQGFDLSLKAPAQLTPGAKVKINEALKHVSILVTAYRSVPGSADNAIMRVSVEDLTSQPHIKDAVDYFDAVRQSYKTMVLPPDFKYSETQAEKLGPKAFAFLDTSSKAGKKRMYATVRNGKAVLFTLSYTNDEDLATMRRILSEGDFSLR